MFRRTYQESFESWSNKRGINETMAIAMGVNAAAAVELADITVANLHLKHF
jgi:hypothetical protein